MHVIKRWTLAQGERMHRGVCSDGEAVKALCEAIFVLH